MSAQRFVTEPAKEKYHIIYIDPPFDYTNTEIEEILKNFK